MKKLKSFFSLPEVESISLHLTYSSSSFMSD